uniref:Uncharacterized protein n=1 Tax=Micrurus carvalhoi TaxID=3147026 RepID=A0A2H6NKH6_9SAUR
MISFCYKSPSVTGFCIIFFIFTEHVCSYVFQAINSHMPPSYVSPYPCPTNQLKLTICCCLELLGMLNKEMVIKREGEEVKCEILEDLSEYLMRLQSFFS